MIRAIALDDEPLPLRLLKAFTKRLDCICLEATFSSAAAAAAYIQQHKPDLLFLDIQMPQVSGIDFLKQLPEDIMVIFMTAHSEYAVEGFNLKAIDYLLKPFEFDRFQQAVEQARKTFNYNQGIKAPISDIYVKADHGLVKIALAEIRYIESIGNYVKVFLDTDKNILIRMSVKDMMEKLKGSDFIRVHRSYIIPLARVLSVKAKVISLGYIDIPIGVSFLKEVQQVFEQKS